MLQFVLGVLLGGVVGFVIGAVCIMADADDRTKARGRKKSGEKKNHE